MEVFIDSVCDMQHTGTDLNMPVDPNAGMDDAVMDENWSEEDFGIQ